MADLFSRAEGLGVGGAVVGVGLVAACWNYLKAWATRLVRLLICTADINDLELVSLLMTEIAANGRCLTGGGRMIEAYVLTEKATGRSIKLPGDVLNKESKVYWYRGALLFVARRKETGLDPNQVAQGQRELVSISWLRWTLDLDALVMSVTRAWRNEELDLTGWKSLADFDATPPFARTIASVPKTADRRGPGSVQTHVRRKTVFGKGYQVVTHTGTAGQQAAGGMSAGVDPGMKTVSSGPSASGLQFSDFQPIGYRRDQFGEPEPKDPAASYAVTPAIEAMLADCDRWLHARDFCEGRGLPWRRGWNLHGSPGSGKSTAVRLVAQTYKLPVHRVFLGTMRTHEFLQVWEQLQSYAPCVALLEDVDAVFHGRDNVVNKKEGVTFDVLLNEIAGVKAANGVLLAITTNHLEHVDPALGVPLDPAAVVSGTTRPGRVDRAFRLPEPSAADRRNVAAKILGGLLTADEIEELVADPRHKTMTEFHAAICARAGEEYWKQVEGESPRGDRKDEHG